MFEFVDHRCSPILPLRIILLGCMMLVAVSGLQGANTPVKRLIVQQEREIAPGVRYAEYKTNGRRPAVVHVVTLDRTIAGNAIRVVKGKDHASSREMIKAMSDRYGRERGDAVLALVNANFWASVRNNPIGPCVIDGEVIEMAPYKGWSSAWFDVRNRIYIDTFKIQAVASWGRTRISIGSANRRMDSLGVVLYNRFAGETVPYVTPDQVEWLFNEAMKDTSFLSDDSTEVELSQAVMRQELAKAQIENSREYPTIKIRMRYLRSPGVNVPTPCRVIGIDTGKVQMPLRGCILSIPRGALAGPLPSVGDTVMLEVGTNLHSETRFMNAVCGTPRIVRDGKAKQEAAQEGVTGRRFIRKNLARTAIGTDRTGNKLIMVAVEPPLRGGTDGLTLDQLASVMQLLGAHHAMNLDGGGSTGMVVEGDHVFYEPDPDTRPVSVGLAIVRLTHILRSRQYIK